MKILVPIKRVIDHAVKIRVKSDGSGVEMTNVKMSINPFDEIALEEAVHLVEAGHASEIVVVTIGDQKDAEILRSAFARGAHRAIRIATEENLSSLTKARVLAKLVEQENPQLILLGKQAIDSDNQQVGAMLAGLLQWPQATCASHIAVIPNGLEIKREIDEGVDVINVTLPAVVTADLRLNQPRYLSLPNIMKAKQQPIEEIALENFQIENRHTLDVLDTFTPMPRKAGVMLKDAYALVDKLREEKVIE
jgi:electron transfer flavoprotein beta subunit